ncbi:MAG: flagellar filament capping protein FliD [Spirochaetaceae bacterium]|jgi:flagellar hook-associated protein 2|nr:flagellar filament capping protein FliD [Spirochaetaceae bacterium]
MADISIPGVKSRFDTEKTIEGLMEIERIPRKRLEQDVENLKTQKTTWQSLGRQITVLRDEANKLYSFQNPFNERTSISSNSSVIDANTTREARDQSHDFSVIQMAQADKFISKPLDKNFKVPAGSYKFSTGESEVSFKFNGGSLQEFSDTLNRRAQGKISSSLIAIKPGTNSIVIGSLVTGAENRLSFASDALKFAVNTGLVEDKKPEPVVTNIKAVPVKNPGEPLDDVQMAVEEDSLKVAVNSDTSVALNSGITPTSSMILKFETSITDNPVVFAADKAALEAAKKAAASKIENEKIIADTNTAEAEGEEISEEAGETAEISESGEIAEEVTKEDPDVENTEDGATETASIETEQTELNENAEASDSTELVEDTETAENTEENTEVVENTEESSDTTPVLTPRIDNLAVLSLKFADGTSVDLSPITDSKKFASITYNLFEISGGKTVTSIEIKNNNSHRDISIRNIQVIETMPKSASNPLNAVSTAQDAIIKMDGIEIERPSNTIDDLIPGVTLTIKSVSESPVNLRVENNTEAVKDAVISLVGNYNKLIAMLNVLTRNDDKILNEITYLNENERNELKSRQGSLSGDSAVTKLRSDLISIVSAAYFTERSGSAVLANFGISTDARGAGAAGYDPSRLRGYLEIDENLFDTAVMSNLEGLQQIMGRDTDGDFIIDSGLAFSLNRVTKPFVDIGGVISNKSSGIDSRIASDNRRIETLDRQLSQKEADLKRKYNQMEEAYNRMESMSNSFDNFNTQQNGGKR